jgi:hypothetical protein
MQKISLRLVIVFVSFGFVMPAFTQTRTNSELLKRVSGLQAEKEKIKYEQLKTLARQKGWEMITKDKKGNTILLIDVDDAGLPRYISTETNEIAAATIGTSTLWPGGSTGLNLNGSSNNVKNKLAVWDGGRVRSTHQELVGRVVQRDAPASLDDHATHTSGTLIASGVVKEARGMSYGQQELIAYDFSGAEPEIINEAANNLLISNHSYGEIAGWRYNDAQSRWEFLGKSDANEDYKFGYYSAQTQLWDSITYNAPFYLMVKSSGNFRNNNGPAVGQPYWRYDVNGVMANAGNRPAGISSNDSYDIISTYGTAKNILTVGAVYPIPYGYIKPEDVIMTNFSSWGPTDDGRIKPDVVADGVNLLSSVAGNDNSYAYYSGTSMASPSTAGSLLLLQEYYSQLHSPNFMRAATLKGLVIHTADEAGPSPGPDYKQGWGLVNMKKAAEVIKSNNTGHLIMERVLNNAATYSLPVVASGNGTISATISWTDPKGDVEPVATALNNPTPKLVHDLDIVIKKGATVYKPWVLNPASPSAAATTGNNILDNVEKVELPDVTPGETYTIEITHKNTLQRGSQAYSLIASGVGGQPYCTSAPGSNAGAKIDSVSFANIQNKNVAGCTTYNNFSNLTGNLQPLQTIPLFIRLASCDASIADKIVKVFIDANNDGDFDDADETLATSGVINGNGDFSTNITLPAGLTRGKYTLMRIVMQETNSAASVTPCGSYTRGETQDYRIYIIQPVSDVGVLEIVAPEAGDCKQSEQYGAIRIRNYGSGPATNVPVSFVIKQGTNTIASLTGTFAGTIAAGSDVEYTFQTPFAMTPGTAYTITSSTSLSTDLITGNNSATSTFTTRNDATAPTGTANICGTSAMLAATSTSTSPFNWYSTLTSPSPLTTGTTASTTTIQSSYYLGTGEVNSKLGPANKMAFPDGSYNQFSPGIRFTATIPTTLKTARLYIGHPGRINFHLRKIGSYNNSDGSYTYFPVSTTTLNVTATAPTPPTLGAQNNNPNDLGAIYYLGIVIPEAGDYILAVEFPDGTAGASIFRNNLITTTNYPYSIPGVITMTGNTAFDAANANYYQGFYYYFYNIAVEPAIGCPSARTAIVATTSTSPSISITGNVLTSTAATGNQWYFNGSPISGANNQTYTATATGSYKVETTDARNCRQFSNEISFTLTAVVNVNPSAIGMIVSPNPTTNGEFHLQFETRKKDNLSISLLNAVGQKVYNQQIPDFIGRYSKTIHPGKLSAGMYYLQVQHDNKMYTQKIFFAQ